MCGKRFSILFITSVLLMILIGCNKADDVKTDPERMCDLSESETWIGMSDSTLEESDDKQKDSEIASERVPNLVIGGVGICDGAISYYVNEFNKEQNEYNVTIYDYLQDGMDSEQALQKLNTEVLLGQGPDILVMDGLEPMAYGTKRLIIDMYPLLISDTMIHEEDIVILNSVIMEKHLFVLPTDFCIRSLSTVHPDFKDKARWSVSEYIAAEEALESWQNMIYYMTAEYFIVTIGGLYDK